MSANHKSLTDQNANTISRVCQALARGDHAQAARIGQIDYPFKPRPRSRRSYTPLQSMLVFKRDGFIDRYSGGRLVFPGTLRLLAILLPDQFPWHAHGKLSESHIVYWDLWPTIDHLVPVSRGGADEEPNWVTTSMLRNQAKLHWTLEELGWSLHPPGHLGEWEGLSAWCFGHVDKHPEVLDDSVLNRWYRAAVRAEAAG